MENDHECGTNTPHIHCLDAFGGTCSGLDTLATDELPQFDGAKELKVDLSGLDTSKTYWVKATPETRFRECPRGECPDVGSADFNICVKEREISFPTVSHPQGINQEETGDDHAYVTNEGQVEDTDGDRRLDIAAYSRNSSPKVYIGDTLNSFVFSSIDTAANIKDTLRRIDMNFPNSNGGEIFRTERMETNYNFYRPGVIRGVPGEEGFQRVVKDEIYDGIDLHYFSNSRGLKMYFVVEPGADPSDIRMRFENPGVTSITGNNGLKLETDLGALTFERAHVYRINPAGNIVPMPPSGDFVHHGNGEYGIDVGNYPDFMPLVIQIDRGHSTRSTGTDNLDWSTYYGGDGGDNISRTESNKNDYTSFIGTTVSTNFPVTSSYQGSNGGSEDLIIGQHSPNEVQEWVTYWGGTKNDGEGGTYRQGISMVPSERTVWIASSTRSKPGANSLSLVDNGTYFDNTNDCNSTPCSDILIGQFLASGVLNWGTLLGGYNPSGFDRAFDCHKNSNGFYVVGEAAGTNFLNGIGGYYSTQGRSIIVQFKDQSIYWGTKFGNIPETEGRLKFFEPDPSNGDFYIGGNILSGGSIPITGPGGAYLKNTKDGSWDAFIANFDNSSKNLKWSTYFGGDGKETFMESKTNDGKIIVTGGTNSSNYPTKKGNSASYFQNQKSGSGVRDVYFNNFSQEVFVTAFDLNSKNLFHSTYFGGQANEMGFGIDVDEDNNIYIVGQTASGNDFPFPANNSPGLYVNNSHNDGNDHSMDGFICGFDNQFNLKWSTYFGGYRNHNIGGSGFDLAWDLDITSKPNLYLCGFTLSNNDFPLNDLGDNSYFDGIHNCQPGDPLFTDGFISRIDLSNTSLSLINKSNNKNKPYILYKNDHSSEYILEVINKKERPFDFKIYSIEGKAVSNYAFIHSVSQHKQIFDGKSAPKGIYILKIKTEDNVYSEKLIFQ